jgi:hypothetical protein
MSALTFNLVRLGYLILLWLFILAAIGVLRRDLMTRGRAAKASKTKAKTSEPVIADIPVAMPQYNGPEYNSAQYNGSQYGDQQYSGALYNEPLYPAQPPGPTPPLVVVGPGNGSAAAHTNTSTGPTALVVSGGPLSGTWLPLSTQTITIGRAPGNTLVLEDGFASARHAQIFWNEGHWFVEDLNSTNGTFLGEQPVSGIVPLPQGIPVHIGESAIELVS